jgi:hypothetical protein
MAAPRPHVLIWKLRPPRRRSSLTWQRPAACHRRPSRCVRRRACFACGSSPGRDADHDLHDQSYVYVQVDGGSWQVEHVRRQIRDAYAPLKAPPRPADAKEGTPAPSGARVIPRPGPAAAGLLSPPSLPGADPRAIEHRGGKSPDRSQLVGARDDTFARPPHRRVDLCRPLFGLGQSYDSPAEQFAAWLPYSAYLQAEQLFVNRDSLGFLLELMPQSGADERMAEVLVSLYSNCPPGTGIQFHLFGSPHHAVTSCAAMPTCVSRTTDQADKAQHWGRPARNDNLFRRLARQRVGHLLSGAQQSLTTGFHYTLRDFRLMLSITAPGSADNLNHRDGMVLLRESIASTLRSALLPNQVCDAAALINWCALFTNPDRISPIKNFGDAPNLHYDDGREIRDQIVDFDTIQDVAPGRPAVVEGRTAQTILEARFYSIKSFPERFALWQMGSLIGDLMQPALQYSAPFLLTMGVHVLDPNVMKSVVTANHVRATQNAKSKMADVMPDVGKKLQDWTAAANAIDIGSSLVSLYHQLAIFSTPHKRAWPPKRPPTPSGAAAASSSTPTSTCTGRRCWPACR